VVRNTPQSPSALAAREPAFVHRQAVGDTYDSAICEIFFATLECELIDRRRFRSHSGARAAVFLFIEGFYNPSRRDSALGYLSPIEYERKHHGLIKPA
jgi:putative transposase